MKNFQTQSNKTMTDLFTLEEKIEIMQHRGFRVIEHDFGGFRTEHNNSPVWIEDIQKAVVVNGETVKLEKKFRQLCESAMRYNIRQIMLSL
jgi:hypothetical protein